MRAHTEQIGKERGKNPHQFTDTLFHYNLDSFRLRENLVLDECIDIVKEHINFADCIQVSDHG